MPAKDRKELTVSSKAKCDRYRGHANPQRKIKCYGVTETQILRITFITKEEFDGFFKGYCCGCFQNCPYRRL